MLLVGLIGSLALAASGEAAPAEPRRDTAATLAGFSLEHRTEPPLRIAEAQPRPMPLPSVRADDALRPELRWQAEDGTQVKLNPARIRLDRRF